MSAWALLLIALLGEPCATPEQASFWVLSPSGDGTASRGSGTGIGPRLVVTNAHVVEHRLAPSVTVGHTLSGETWQGRTIAVSSGPDLALIWIEGNVPHVPLAERDPRAGDAVALFGYGSSKVLRTNRGEIVGGNTGQSGYVVLNSTVPLESGDSGGGLFDESGRLAAVNWGTDGSESSSTPISAVWELLASASQRKGVDLAACQDCGAGGSYGGGPMRPVQPDPGQRPSGDPQPWRKAVDDLGGRLTAVEQAQQKQQATLDQVSGRLVTLVKQPGDLSRRTQQLEVNVAGHATLFGKVTALLEQRHGEQQAAKGEVLAQAKTVAADVALTVVESHWPAIVTWAVGLGGGGAGVGLAIGIATWIANRRLKKLHARVIAKLDRGPTAPRVTDPPASPLSFTDAASNDNGLTRDLAACREARARQQAELDRLAIELRRERAEVERVRNHYVQVTDNSTDAAWARSHALVAQQYPGAASYFQLSERLKDQIVSGQQPAPLESIPGA